MEEEGENINSTNSSEGKMDIDEDDSHQELTSSDANPQKFTSPQDNQKIKVKIKLENPYAAPNIAMGDSLRIRKSFETASHEKIVLKEYFKHIYHLDLEQVCLFFMIQFYCFS